MRNKRKLLVPLGILLSLQVATYIVGRRLRRQYLDQGAGPNSFNAVAVMQGNEERVEIEDLRGGNLRVIMGGLDLDLRDAAVQQRPAVVETTVVMGGAEIRVPPGWTVETELATVMAGVVNRRGRPPKGEPPNLVLRGKVILGGIDIR
jgi:hypothetical protein